MNKTEELKQKILSKINVCPDRDCSHCKEIHLLLDELIKESGKEFYEV
jgi:hypothetical protein